MITIKFQNIERLAKQIEKKNFKKTSESLSWVSMLNHLPFISTTHHNSTLVDVEDNWKDQMNQQFLN